jgi:hypothetical protein
MGVFHMYALAPIMSNKGLQRVGVFFFMNGLGTVAEAIVWGHRKHWLKATLAWIFGVLVSSWTAEAARIPNGLSKITWREVCDAPHY